MFIHARVRRFFVTVSAAVLLAPALLAADAAAGATAFNQTCAMCHGKDGSGATAMGQRMGLRDLKSPEVQKMSDTELEGIVANGKKGAKGSMPGYQAKLGAAGVKNVVAYMRQLAKGK